jgi:hypothetical protein
VQDEITRGGRHGHCSGGCCCRVAASAAQAAGESRCLGSLSTWPLAPWKGECG